MGQPNCVQEGGFSNGFSNGFELYVPQVQLDVCSQRSVTLKVGHLAASLAVGAYAKSRAVVTSILNKAGICTSKSFMLPVVGSVRRVGTVAKNILFTTMDVVAKLMKTLGL